jgi:hypothetical protein
MDHQNDEATLTEALTDRDLMYVSHLPCAPSAHLLTALSTAANQRNSPLLRLPAELRNRVYELASRDAMVHIKTLEDFVSQQETINDSTGVIALPLVCKQIHHEAVPRLLYLQSTFHTTPSRFAEALASNSNIGRENCKLITSLVISFGQAADLAHRARTNASLAHFIRAGGSRYYEQPKLFDDVPMVKKVHMLNRSPLVLPFVTRDQMVDALRKNFEQKELEITFEVAWISHF